MTPNQKHAQEEYDRFMPKLVAARDAATLLGNAKTSDEVVVAFAAVGSTVKAFLDEMIVDMDDKHTRTMSRTF